MDYREKDEKNVCCTLCGESDRSPEYGPEIHRFRNGRGDAEIVSYKVFPGIGLDIYSQYAVHPHIHQQVQYRILIHSKIPPFLGDAYYL